MVLRLEFFLSRSQSRDLMAKVSVLVSRPKKGLDNNTENRSVKQSRECLTLCATCLHTEQYNSHKQFHVTGPKTPLLKCGQSQSIKNKTKIKNTSPTNTQDKQSSQLQLHTPQSLLLLHCVRQKVTPCIHCHNSGKQCQILTEFFINNAISNCKQITKF